MNPATCPACSPTVALAAGRCPSCDGDVLSSADVELLAARVGVGVGVLREVLASAEVSPLHCAGCATVMRRFPLRGVAVDVCGHCGEGFLGAVARVRLAEPSVPPKAAASATARAATAVPQGGAGVPAGMLDKARFLLAPLAALASTSAIAGLLLYSPFLPAVVAALLLPMLIAPTAAMVTMAVLPHHQRAGAWIAAVVLTAAAAPHTFRVIDNHIVALSTFAISVVCAGLIVSPTVHRIRLKRVAAALALIVAMTASGYFGLAAYHREKTEGCPDGARWSDIGGRACRAADGLRHGPGVIEVDGRVLERGAWRKGKRHGQFQLYYTNVDAPRAEGAFKHGREEGPWIHFDDKGSIEASGRYRNGKRHGRWTERDADGQKHTVMYRAGVPIPLH